MQASGSRDSQPRDAASLKLDISEAEKSDTGSELRPNHEHGTFNLDSNASAEDLDEDSPYPEVRCAVANFDDPEMPASTIRAWILGLFWSIILSGINQFYHYRWPTLFVPALVAQLLVYPLGRLWGRLMPRWTIFGYSLNPGPFTIKEHVLITIMANVSYRSAYATDIIATQRFTYKQETTFTYRWLLVMSTQLVGFSVGGIARRFLVTPPSMIWPNTLVSCALFNTLHSSSYSFIGRQESKNRNRLFIIAFFSAGIWYIFPGFLFQALSYFTWVCWIAPDNIVVNQLFGYRSGLGASLITFDWNQIAYIGSPLATPWWAEANVLAGFILSFWIITPLAYYLNAWNSQYFPIWSVYSFDNTGRVYNVSRILTAKGGLDIQAYRSYSPPFLAASFAIGYGVQFAAVTAVITHALLYFRRPIMAQFSRSMREQPDIHAKLMAHYPEVPEWWYLCVLAMTFAAGAVCVEVWHSGLPVWGLLLSLFIALVYIIPIGMIKATTNRDVALNLITELIVGYILPGRPVAMMMFKTWGYISSLQALIYVSDLKLGHYMKIPPRPMFWAQVTASALAGTVQLGVQAWMFSNIDKFCDPEQTQNFTCNTTQVFSTASILWGLIGPQVLYSEGRLYYALCFAFAIGALIPVATWLLSRKFPRIGYINFPVMVASLSLSPPATAVNYVPWAIVGYIFQYLIRRYRYSWWAKYNYVLSAALDAGTGVSIILIFFCLEYPLDGQIAKAVGSWWGNKVFQNTKDWKGPPLRVVPPGTTIGPTTW